MNHFRLLILGVLVVLGSCKKDKPVPTPDLTPSNQLNILFRFGNQELKSNENYIAEDGRKVNFGLINFYMSNIALKTDTGYVPLVDLFLLCNSSKKTYELPEFSAQNFTAIRFSIGVDSIINAGDPTDYKTTDPLGLQSDIPMHWGWNTGYVFAILEGKFDDTPDKTGLPEASWVYHIGLNQFFMENIEIPITSSKIDLVFDASGIFKDVDLMTESETMSTSNTALASKISNNLKNHVFKKAF